MEGILALAEDAAFMALITSPVPALAGMCPPAADRALGGVLGPWAVLVPCRVLVLVHPCPLH